MIGIDTSVFLHFLVDDDPKQHCAARTMMAERHANDPVFIGAVTPAETVEVSAGALGYPVNDVSAPLRDLTAGHSVIVEYADEPGSMPGQGNEPKVELADDLPGWTGVAAGGARTVTFDSNAAGTIPSMERHT